MKYKEIKDLIEKYQNGTATPKEKGLLESWYIKYVQSKSGLIYPQELMAKMDKALLSILTIEQVQPKKLLNIQKTLWPRLIAAASIILMAGSILYLYNAKSSKSDQHVVYTNDVASGKQGATLTLANGRKIKLGDASNGELAKEAGVSISKTANGQIVYEIKDAAGESNKINKLTTAKGETYVLSLPDKSKVWMNAASSLTYSSNLTVQGMRRVKLEGEAYFEIAKDKAHPFIVESNGQQVEVLGTHFNVNSYTGEPVKTTLVEGSIKVSNQLQTKIIKPGQQSVIAGTGNISVSAVNTELALAWTKNEFMFESEPIENVMKMVERWYNVEVVYTGEKPTSKFGGSVSRFDSVSKVLQVLESTGEVHFKIQGRKIYVSK